MDGEGQKGNEREDCWDGNEEGKWGCQDGWAVELRRPKGLLESVLQGRGGVASCFVNILQGSRCMNAECTSCSASLLCA